MIICIVESLVMRDECDEREERGWGYGGSVSQVERYIFKIKVF